MIYPEGKVDEIAFFAGVSVGLSGEEVMTCPHSPGSVKGKSWRSGFDQGRELWEMTAGSPPSAVVYASPKKKRDSSQKTAGRG